MVSDASSRRRSVGRHHRYGWAPVAVILLAPGGITVGCTEASPEGTALLHNEIDQTNLRIVVRNTDGDVIGEATFDEGYQFDTQFPDRETQCLVARDGGFKIFRPDGEVLATHSFADRPVCSLDELVLKGDGSVVWQ